jgi:hypothetical protein
MLLKEMKCKTLVSGDKSVRLVLESTEPDQVKMLTSELGDAINVVLSITPFSPSVGWDGLPESGDSDLSTGVEFAKELTRRMSGNPDVWKSGNPEIQTSKNPNHEAED